MKEDNYNDIPINEDYIPRHASNYNNLNYINAKDTTLRNWNEEYIKQNNCDTNTTIHKSNNILDNLDKIDCSKYYKVDLDSNKEKEENEKKQVEIPDVRNLTIKEATKILEEKKLESNLDTDIEVDEKKVVTDMFPKPGVKVNEGSSIILYYNNN